MELQTEDKQKKIDLYILPALLGLAAIFRLFQLNIKGLWFDEAFEYWASVVPLKYLFSVVSTSLQPPLYNILLHFWLKFSDSDLWMRLLSVFLDLLGILAILRLCRKHFNRITTVLIGLIAAVMPAMIRYAQETGEYALLLCCLMWFIHFMVTAYHSKAWKDWLLTGLFALLACYSHFGAFIAVAGAYFAILVLFCIEKEKEGVKKLLISGLITAALTSFSIITLLKQAQQQRAPFEILKTSGMLDVVKYFFVGYLNSLRFFFTGYQYSKISALIPWAVISIISIIGLALLIKSKHSQRVFSLIFISTFLLYAGLVIPGFYAYGSFGFRYANILIPGFLLLLGNVFYFLSEQPKLIIRTGAFVIAIVLITLSILSLPNRGVSVLLRGEMDWPETDDMNQAVAFWAQEKSQDAFTFISFRGLPGFVYYARDQIQETSSPSPGWMNSCWIQSKTEFCDNELYYMEPWLSTYPVESRIDNLLERIDDHNEVWLIFGSTTSEEIAYWQETMLQQGYKLHESFEGSRVAAYRFIR